MHQVGNIYIYSIWRIYPETKGIKYLYVFSYFPNFYTSSSLCKFKEGLKILSCLAQGQFTSKLQSLPLLTKDTGSEFLCCVTKTCLQTNNSFNAKLFEEAHNQVFEVKNVTTTPLSLLWPSLFAALPPTSKSDEF